MNTDTKELFTSGEWTVSFGRHTPEAPIFGYCIKVEGRNAYVALQGVYEHNVAINSYNGATFEGCYTPEEVEANAHLIAASKDLYYALKKIALMFPILKIDPALKIDIEAALQKANPKL